MSTEVSNFYQQPDWKPTCITYSYALAWHKNKNAFRSKYYKGEEQKSIAAYIFGSEVSDMIKNDPTNPLLKNLTRYPQVDEEYRTMLGDVEFVFHPDMFSPDMFAFREIKTGMRTSSGKPSWTDAKVQKHMQLDCYSLGIESLFGQVNEVCHLDWLVKDRKEIEILDGIMTDGPIYLTDEVISFERVITPLERYKAKEWLLQAYYEILLDFKSYTQQATCIQ